jgi:hypothetical protein
MMHVIKQLSSGVRSLTMGSLLACFASVAWGMDDPAALTSVESKWLDAAEPVLAFAATQGFPIDVIVQPRSGANDAPFAIGVQARRCKLILSLRDRPDAEATLANVPLERHALMIEAMTAHEVAHCWRYQQGTWNLLPAGFVEPVDAGDSEQLADKKRRMRSVRREEGYADLAALAWIQREHPEDYAEVYAWLTRVRQDQPLAGSFHDTRVWLRLVEDATVFPAAGSPFDKVQELWAAGLRKEK